MGSSFTQKISKWNRPSNKIKIKRLNQHDEKKTRGWGPLRNENDDLWMVCETAHVHLHKYKVHVRADTWDGSKCLVVNKGLSCFQAWVRERGVGGYGIPRLPQELRVNWSCSMGFLTQAPKPALWKALMSACLAEWYSVAACFASW